MGERAHTVWTQTMLYASTRNIIRVHHKNKKVGGGREQGGRKIFCLNKNRGDFQQNFKTSLANNEHSPILFNHQQNLSHMFFQVKFIRKKLLLENHMWVLTWQGQARAINPWTLQICKADINNKLNPARCRAAASCLPERFELWPAWPLLVCVESWSLSPLFVVH